MKYFRLREKDIFVEKIRDKSEQGRQLKISC